MDPIVEGLLPGVSVAPEAEVATSTVSPGVTTPIAVTK